MENPYTGIIWKQMEVAIRNRHGACIQRVRGSDMMMELMSRGIFTIEDAIRWSDEVFGRK